MAVAALERAGYTVVPFQPPAIDTAINLWCSILVADGMDGFVEAAGGETFIKQYLLMMASARAPAAVRGVARALMWALGMRRTAELAGTAHPRTVIESEKLEAQRAAYVHAFYDSWAVAGIDAMLCPGFGVAPFVLGDSAKLNPSAASYTMFINLLNTAAGTVPVTVVDVDEQIYQGPVFSLEPFHSAARAATAFSVGLPIGVQVYGKPFDDETVVRVLKDIEAGVGFTAVSPLRATI